MRTLLLATACLLSAPAKAEGKALIVGVRPNPPFMFHNPDGSWNGIAVDLWRHVAGELKLPFELREYQSAKLRSADNKHMLPLEANGLDVLASAIIDGDTAEFNDATAPYYFSGLSIATLPESKRGFADFARKLLTIKFLQGVALLALAPVAMGLVIWRMERRRNRREFGGPQTRGVAAAVLWACESMVGKSRPILRTWPARILTICWTFGCIMLLSYVTAKLSSQFTLHQLKTRVSGPRDLPNVKVGARKTSSGMLYLDKRGIAFTGYDSDAAAIEGLSRGEVDAVISSSAILQYFVSKNYQGRIVVLPGTFTNYGIAFGLRRGSPLCRPINLAMLKFLETDDWRKVVGTYLGGSQ